jgi:hypothetical protein
MALLVREKNGEKILSCTQIQISGAKARNRGDSINNIIVICILLHHSLYTPHVARKLTTLSDSPAQLRQRYSTPSYYCFFPQELFAVKKRKLYFIVNLVPLVSGWSQRFIVMKILLSVFDIVYLIVPTASESLVYHLHDVMIHDIVWFLSN